MAEHNDFGAAGEQMARDYLAKEGYTILETNWRHLSHEVDIIAKKGDILAFVEVKTRNSRFLGEPEIFVSRTQQKAYITVADAYVTKNNRTEEVRFDIVSIVLNSKEQSINHIEGAFSTIR
ncbi:MAG: YraN family protein [Bacteroidales bacterium]|jgi:putative endonuclease|nr:YraN family protein [Bacteroidales bacterium]MBP5241092.1 YraN family protein [Bacteroidales bacterium]